jgi:hypothetical protein
MKKALLQTKNTDERRLEITDDRRQEIKIETQSKNARFARDIQ